MASQLPNVLGGRPQSDLRLVLLGREGAGKSVVAHSLLGRENWRKRGMCEMKQGEVEGRSVTVVDTPAWDRESVKLTGNEIKNEIVHSVTLCPPGPHAVILVVPLEQLPGKEWKSIQDHMELLSDRVWKHTLVLFVSESESFSQSLVEQAKKSARDLLEKCGDRHHVLCGSMSSNHTQLLQKIEVMGQEQSDEFFLPQVYYDLKQRYDLLLKEMEDKLHGTKTEQGTRKRRGSYELDPPNMNTEKQEDEPGRQKVDQVAIGDGGGEIGMIYTTIYSLVIITVLIIAGAIAGAQNGTSGVMLGIVAGVAFGLLVCFVAQTAITRLIQGSSTTATEVTRPGKVK